jgi:hypothetical protein
MDTYNIYKTSTNRDDFYTNDIDVLRRSRVCVAFRNAVVVVDLGRVVLVP